MHIGVVGTVFIDFNGSTADSDAIQPDDAELDGSELLGIRVFARLHRISTSRLRKLLRKANVCLPPVCCTLECVLAYWAFVCGPGERHFPIWVIWFLIGILIYLLAVDFVPVAQACTPAPCATYNPDSHGCACVAVCICDPSGQQIAITLVRCLMHLAHSTSYPSHYVSMCG